MDMVANFLSCVHVLAYLEDYSARDGRNKKRIISVDESDVRKKLKLERIRLSWTRLISFAVGVKMM
jgi:hypothetical protein